MSKKKKPLKNIPSSNFIQIVYDRFKNHPDTAFTVKQIAHNIHASPEERARLSAIIGEFVMQGTLKETGRGRYKLNVKKEVKEIIGKVSMSRDGHGFVVHEDYEDEIFISPRNMRHALHGDTVRIAVNTRKHRPEGMVTEIIGRSNRPFVGMLQVSPKQAFVMIESRYMPYDIRVSKNHLHGANNGDKVAVMIKDWPMKEKEPFGEICEVLGVPGENNTEMHAILAEFGLPYRFPSAVEQEADKISENISPKEIAARRDFRKVNTFTIDPADAKDFDDALSLRKLADGNWEVGIHIADVTHYVLPGTLVEKEAATRATSVYLVDRTVPMLPEQLSNKLCSLRPNEEKLCFSAVFEMNDEAQVKNQWFGHTVICSDYRFDYDLAQNVIETKQGPCAEELLTLHELAQKLRAERFKKGAIAFDQPEAKVEVDENGKPLRIHFKEMKDSNFLIEEFMLLANRCVAEFVAKYKQKRNTFVYRIHEEPNMDKLNIFREFIKNLGYKMPPAKTPRDIAKALNKVLDSARGKPEAHVIEMIALRSMSRARYATQNVGHYGLAFDYYTHFTSPIRRYPDMMVHRLLTHYLQNGQTVNKTQYEEFCKYSSEREQIATEAELASIKYKMVEFMQDKVGQLFEGVVSGVTEWGIYVELDENGIEGMVPMREMQGDYYTYNEKKFAVVGQHYGKSFTYGSPVRVRVIRVNLEQRLMDFQLEVN